MSLLMVLFALKRLHHSADADFQLA